MQYIPEYIEEITRELIQRENYLGKENIVSIYLGGGTPSLLTKQQIQKIISVIRQHYCVIDQPEITLEANPEDLTEEYLIMLSKTDINRVSIGCQTFDPEALTLLNRRHSSDQAIYAVNKAHQIGFENISVDLIYGIPGMSVERWKKNLDTVLSLPVNHLSAYHLSVEENTVFFHWIKEKKIKMPGEESSLAQYEYLVNFCRKQKFDHYEISSFAAEDYYSRHNLLYWNQCNYLGVGASAHSYNGNSRRWNTSNIVSYLKGMKEGKPYFGEERLNKQKKYNEYIMTRLRTRWGIKIEEFRKTFGYKWCDNFIREIKKYMDEGFVEIGEDNIYITETGMFISDHIISDLFLVQ